MKTTTIKSSNLKNYTESQLRYFLINCYMYYNSDLDKITFVEKKYYKEFEAKDKIELTYFDLWKDICSKDDNFERNILLGYDSNDDFRTYRKLDYVSFLENVIEKYSYQVA